MHRRIAVVSAALLLVLPLVGCTDEYGTDDTAPSDAPSVVDARVAIGSAAGTVSIAVAAGFASQTGLRPGALGRATASGSTVRLPIESGQVTASDSTVDGSLLLTSSGMSLTRGSRVVELTGLSVDIGAGALVGSVGVDGKVRARNVLLADLGFLRPRLPEDRSVRLQNTTLVLRGDAAKVVDDVTGDATSSAGATLGTADIVVRSA